MGTEVFAISSKPQDGISEIKTSTNHSNVQDSVKMMTKIMKLCGIKYCLEHRKNYWYLVYSGIVMCFLIFKSINSFIWTAPPGASQVDHFRSILVGIMTVSAMMYVPILNIAMNKPECFFDKFLALTYNNGAIYAPTLKKMTKFFMFMVIVVPLSELSLSFGMMNDPLLDVLLYPANMSTPEGKAYAGIIFIGCFYTTAMNIVSWELSVYMVYVLYKEFKQLSASVTKHYSDPQPENIDMEHLRLQYEQLCDLVNLSSDVLSNMIGLTLPLVILSICVILYLIANSTYSYSCILMITMILGINICHLIFWCFVPALVNHAVTIHTAFILYSLNFFMQSILNHLICNWSQMQ